MGRPTKWKDNYIADVVFLKKRGYTDLQVMAEWGISADTFYKWTREKEDFKEAYSLAEASFGGFYENMLILGMTKEIALDAGLFKEFMSANVKKYRKILDQKSINIDNMQVNNYSNMDKDALLDHIQHKLRINHLDEEKPEKPKKRSTNRAS